MKIILRRSVILQQGRMEGTEVTAAGTLAGQSTHVEDIHRQHGAQARQETGRCHCINATRLASFTARVRVGQMKF